ncbi:Iron hydrogenase 1 [Candidatus Izimaplasma bacterium HR1]|jgi:[FeFe] hydrogenase (group B1/B3)|uniref:4Fe-4S dicluster domain-containing protein n=1 Tax=Candidatus Izimoplasma sp. HR1 TaxID=1541959 RepID=UPI0004F8CA1A|nr:Iron hydrogenase 1 [Candidatus Izimaplasma bacterium HR1]
MNYKFESDIQKLKYEVLKQAALVGFSDNQNINRDEIAEGIIPGPKPTFRCCIYKERTIIKERLLYALNEKDDEHIIKVIEPACDQCPIDRYTITNSCRGCIARSCQNACPVNAICIVQGRAYINQEKCVECGRCEEACQFNAISDTKRPCKRSCPVDAIDMDENKIAKIDYEKCISCGQCAYNCPFGAITDVTYIKSIAEKLSQNKNMYALIAPSISSQFDSVTIGQITHALKQIGFTDVIEVALGADMVIQEETKEFKNHIKNANYMTTSCCPSFVNLVEKKFPTETTNISTTVSPMVALGRFIKQLHQESTNVFIGPCMAKKEEMRRTPVKDAIDYVLTFEELRSLLGAKEIDLKTIEVDPLNNASYYGRMFAIHGGVSSSIKNYIESEDIAVEYNPVAANGAKDCIKQMTLAKNKKMAGNFLEGMVCHGGCISGPGSTTHRKKDAMSVKKYALEAKEKTTKDSLQIIDMKSVNMSRV